MDGPKEWFSKDSPNDPIMAEIIVWIRVFPKIQIIITVHFPIERFAIEFSVR